jgi:hypothetical protein
VHVKIRARHFMRNIYVLNRRESEEEEYGDGGRRGGEPLHAVELYIHFRSFYMIAVVKGTKPTFDPV